MYWSIPEAIWGYSVIGWTGLFCGVAAFIGLMFSHAPFQADNQAKHVGGMAGIGLARMALTVGPIAYLHPMFLYFQYAGVTSGLAYYFGWTYLDGVDSGISFPGLTLFGKQIIQPGKFATGGGEWGEVLTGAFDGLIFATISILAQHIL